MTYINKAWIPTTGSFGASGHDLEFAEMVEKLFPAVIVYFTPNASAKPDFIDGSFQVQKRPESLEVKVVGKYTFDEMDDGKKTMDCFPLVSNGISNIPIARAVYNIQNWGEKGLIQIAPNFMWQIFHDQYPCVKGLDTFVDPLSDSKNFKEVTLPLIRKEKF